jgi:hypothetical protein
MMFRFLAHGNRRPPIVARGNSAEAQQLCGLMNSGINDYASQEIADDGQEAPKIADLIAHHHAARQAPSALASYSHRHALATE